MSGSGTSPLPLVRGRRLPPTFANSTKNCDRDGEDWDPVVHDHCNPQHTTTDLNPGLVADDQSLRFLTQLHLAGRRLRGFCRRPPGTGHYPCERGTVGVSR